MLEVREISEFFRAGIDVRLDLGQANAALILPSIGQEANAEEAQYHHCPGRGFGNGRNCGHRVEAIRASIYVRQARRNADSEGA